MQSAFLIVVCLSITFTRAVGNGSINYCGSRMCGNTDAHTFCRYSEGPSHDCMGYITAGLSNDEISRVIARLNRRRNEAASGRLRRLHSAGNMLKLRWVDELAREAQRWADQCRPPSVPEEHDACRDLYSISIGQCVASVVGEAPGLRVESMVDIWYMQNMLYKGNTTIYIPPNRNSSFYGDFAQIMWSESYMVGCGRSKFMSPWQGRLRSVERLVCNIAPRGPPPLRPLWSPSAPTALCPSRSKPDNHFHALCDIPETVQELQDALERMEVDLSTSSIIDKQGKVRRELREAGEDRLNEKIEMGKDILNDETEKNSSIDKSLMYNMVLKYMPYLRQYHGGLLSTGANKAVNISSSILKFLLICICNVRLLM